MLLEELAAAPVVGVVLAHELLDAFPVDRIVLGDGQLALQAVALQERRNPGFSTVASAGVHGRCHRRVGFAAAPAEAEEGWCSEWHGSYRTWLQSLSKAVDHGVLLVIDYALEAARYYAARRSDGTLMAYQGGAAGLDPLASPGTQDLTSHVCIDTLDAAAAGQGWQRLDQRRQGEMVLALGLAERLHALQQLPPQQLPQALQRREALLRLVDPAGFGEFRWLLYGRGIQCCAGLSLQADPDS